MNKRKYCINCGRKGIYWGRSMFNLKKEIQTCCYCDMEFDKVIDKKTGGYKIRGRIPKFK